MTSSYQIGLGGNSLKGYIYKEDGRYSFPITIPIDEKQIASFLVRTKNAFKVHLDNHFDLMEIVTLAGSGGFLDKCTDQKYLTEKLLPVLIPMQQGEIEPEELRIVSWGGAEEQFGVDEVRKWYNETFGVEL